MIKTNIELFINIFFLLFGSYQIMIMDISYSQLTIFLLLLAFSCYGLSLVNIYLYAKKAKLKVSSDFELKLKHLKMYNNKLYFFTPLFCYSVVLLAISKTIHNDSHFIKDSSFDDIFRHENVLSNLFINTNFGYILFLTIASWFVISIVFSSKQFFIRFIKE